MYKLVKCPACNKFISNVYFEQYEPSIIRGGSQSYVAVAEPCGHALSAVPSLWEAYIKGIQEQQKLKNREVQNLKYQIDEIQNNVRHILQRIK